MIVIVDFDGTLALGTMSRIKERKPNTALIQRLHDMKRTINPTIKVVTARGSRSNLSEAEKIARYMEDMVEWLQRNDVPYDSISFNKEYGCVYIDDLTIGQHEDFSCIQSPFTKNKIILTANSVIKYTPNADNEQRWYELAAGIVPTPFIHSCNQDMIVMSRIQSHRKPTATEIIDLIESYKDEQIANEPFETYLRHVSKSNYGTQTTRKIIASLEPHPGTFFHGDLSTTNVLICTETGIPYCIDSNYKGVFGSYITDAAKAFFSFVAYERQYEQAKLISDKYGNEVIRFAVAEGLRVCKYDQRYVSIVNNIADLA